MKWWREWGEIEWDWERGGGMKEPGWRWRRGSGGGMAKKYVAERKKRKDLGDIREEIEEINKFLGEVRKRVMNQVKNDSQGTALYNYIVLRLALSNDTDVALPYICFSLLG